MKELNKLNRFFLNVVLFVFPLFFLPLLSDSFDLGKKIFLTSALSISYLFWGISIVLRKKIELKNDNLIYNLLAFLLVVLVSSLVAIPNKMYTLTSIFGVFTLGTLVLTYFIIKSIGRPRNIVYSLLASGVVLALIRLALFLGRFTFPLPISSNVSIAIGFSPTGTLIAQAVFFLILVPISLALAIEEFKEKKIISLLTFLFSFLIIVSLGVSVYLLSSSAKPILLPQATAWTIAVETLKDPKNAILGLGPNQFINAFSSFKPMGFNNTDLWNLRFASSSNWYFQLLVEVGLLGLFTYLFLVIRIVKRSLFVLYGSIVSKKISLNTGIAFSLILLLILQYFLPLNFFLWALLFVLLGIFKHAKEKLNVFNLSLAGSAISALGLTVIILVFSFFAVKSGLGSYYYVQSFQVTNDNQAIRAYNLYSQILKYDPYQPSYHLQYSILNLSLAGSLAQEKDLSDTDRQQITSLIEQSIREAKSATALDPQNAALWENMATIYHNLINFAEGADLWAINTYQQAINLDPFNPILRVNLGGIYFSQRDWNNAINLFSQATIVKPDFANAHYNLANALRESGNVNKAKEEYEITQSLVKVGTPDYQKVTNELEEIKKRLPATPAPVQTQGTETLFLPETNQNKIEPPLDILNEEPSTP